VGGDSPTVLLDEALHDGEAEAEAAARAMERDVALRERLEDGLEHLGGEANAPILHAEDRLPVLPARDHADRLPGGRVLDGVVEEVADDLLEANRITFHHEGARIREERDVLRARHRRLARLDALADDLPEIEGTPLEGDLARHDPGYIEQVVDEAGEMLSLTADDGPRPPLGLRSGIESIEHGGGVDDRGQGIAELVPQHGQEIVLGLARALGRGARGAELRLHALADRQVVARLVLPPPRAERGPDRRHQGDGADRPLEDRDVPVLRQRVEHAEVRAGRVPARRKDHQGQVRPGRLLLAGLEEELGRRLGERLLGQQRRPRARADGLAERVDSPADFRGYSGAGQDVARDRAVPTHRRQDENPVLRDATGWEHPGRTAFPPRRSPECPTALPGTA
jgi:hypothetical protein